MLLWQKLLLLKSTLIEHSNSKWHTIATYSGSTLYETHVGGQEESGCVHATDIQGRSQTLYIAPCNGVVRHGAQTEDIRVFADHTRKQNKSTIFAHSFGFSRSDHSTYTPDKSQLIWSWEKPEYL